MACTKAAGSPTVLHCNAEMYTHTHIFVYRQYACIDNIHIYIQILYKLEPVSEHEIFGQFKPQSSGQHASQLEAKSGTCQSRNSSWPLLPGGLKSEV